MKAVILTSGFVTRISEVTLLKPKHMVEICDIPILWHIMRIYSAHGIHHLIICRDHKSSLFKEYFSKYFLHISNVAFDMKNNSAKVHHQHSAPWRIILVSTGENTLTDGRLNRVSDFLSSEELFCFTYSVEPSNINITKQIAFHQQHANLAPISPVQSSDRYGVLQLNHTTVTEFMKKPRVDYELTRW